VTPTPANCNNCGARAAWLEGLGVPGHRVSMLAPPVTNTYTESCGYCTPLLRAATQLRYLIRTLR
jgi:hypothetical protein